MPVLTWRATGKASNTQCFYACNPTLTRARPRLKISLDLPPLDPRPPVPPRIYKRLYNHLDHILPNHTPGGGGGGGGGRTPRVRTPSAKLREQDDFLGSRSKASFLRTTTPGKERSLSDFRTPPPAGSKAGTTPLSASSSRRTGRASAARKPPGAAAGLPPWVRPALRHLCKQLDATVVGPTVIAGMEAIVCPHGRRTKDEWVLGHMTSLLGSLYLYVWNTVSMPDGVDETRYVAARKDVVEALDQARQTIAIKDVEDDEAWKGWQDIQVADIDDAALTVNRHGWLESDWAKGMEDLIQRDQDNAAERAAAAKATWGTVEPVRRADTMLQEKYDYLSEKRRREYTAWKKKIMKEIARLDRQKERVDVMEVDGS